MGDNVEICIRQIVAEYGPDVATKRMVRTAYKERRGLTTLSRAEKKTIHFFIERIVEELIASSCQKRIIKSEPSPSRSHCKSPSKSNVQGEAFHRVNQNDGGNHSPSLNPNFVTHVSSTVHDGLERDRALTVHHDQGHGNSSKGSWAKKLSKSLGTQDRFKNGEQRRKKLIKPLADRTVSENISPTTCLCHKTHGRGHGQRQVRMRAHYNRGDSQGRSMRSFGIRETNAESDFESDHEAKIRVLKRPRKVLSAEVVRKAVLDSESESDQRHSRLSYVESESDCDQQNEIHPFGRLDSDHDEPLMDDRMHSSRFNKTDRSGSVHKNESRPKYGEVQRGQVPHVVLSHIKLDNKQSSLYSEKERKSLMKKSSTIFKSDNENQFDQSEMSEVSFQDGCAEKKRNSHKVFECEDVQRQGISRKPRNVPSVEGKLVNLGSESEYCPSDDENSFSASPAIVNRKGKAIIVSESEPEDGDSTITSCYEASSNVGGREHCISDIEEQSSDSQEIDDTLMDIITHDDSFVLEKERIGNENEDIQTEDSDGLKNPLGVCEDAESVGSDSKDYGRSVPDAHSAKQRNSSAREKQALLCDGLDVVTVSSEGEGMENSRASKDFSLQKSFDSNSESDQRCRRRLFVEDSDFDVQNENQPIIELDSKKDKALLKYRPTSVEKEDVHLKNVTSLYCGKVRREPIVVLSPLKLDTKQSFVLQKERRSVIEKKSTLFKSEGESKVDQRGASKMSHQEESSVVMKRTSLKETMNSKRKNDSSSIEPLRKRTKIFDSDDSDCEDVQKHSISRKPRNVPSVEERPIKFGSESEYCPSDATSIFSSPERSILVSPVTKRKVKAVMIWKSPPEDTDYTITSCHEASSSVDGRGCRKPHKEIVSNTKKKKPSSSIEPQHLRNRSKTFDSDPECEDVQSQGISRKPRNVPSVEGRPVKFGSAEREYCPSDATCISSSPEKPFLVSPVTKCKVKAVIIRESQPEDAVSTIISSSEASPIVDGKRDWKSYRENVSRKKKEKHSSPETLRKRRRKSQFINSKNEVDDVHKLILSTKNKSPGVGSGRAILNSYNKYCLSDVKSISSSSDKIEMSTSYNSDMSSPSETEGSGSSVTHAGDTFSMRTRRKHRCRVRIETVSSYEEDIEEISFRSHDPLEMLEDLEQRLWGKKEMNYSRAKRFSYKQRGALPKRKKDMHDSCYPSSEKDRGKRACTESCSDSESPLTLSDSYINNVKCEKKSRDSSMLARSLGHETFNGSASSSPVLASDNDSDYLPCVAKPSSFLTDDDDDESRDDTEKRRKVTKVNPSCDSENNKELGNLRKICRFIGVVLRNSIELRGCDSPSDKVDRIKALLKEKGLKGRPCMKNAQQFLLEKELKDLGNAASAENDCRRSTRSRSSQKETEKYGKMHKSPASLFSHLGDIFSIDDFSD